MQHRSITLGPSQHEKRNRSMDLSLESLPFFLGPIFIADSKEISLKKRSWMRCGVTSSRQTKKIIKKKKNT